MQLNIPEVTLLEEVGRGPDSVVYKALHRGRSCSVKVPSDRPAADTSGMLTRFEQDVLALARLRRFGLPRVLQLGATDETAYAILADCAGEPLSQTLTHKLTRVQLLTVAHKLVASVKQLHAAGFVHGNLSAYSILVSGPDLDVSLEDRGSINRPMPFDARPDLRALGVALRQCLSRVTDDNDTLSRLWVRVDELASGASVDCSDVLAELDASLQGPRTRSSEFPPPNEPLASAAAPSGTRTELTQLLRASRRAASYGGRLIEVLGPAGSGKSRLLMTYAQEIAGDTQLLSVRCRDSDWAPFSALKRLLEGHLVGIAQLEQPRRAVLEAALRDAAGPMAAPIGLLSPRLAELFSDATRVMSEGDVQRVFVEGLAEFLIKYLDSSGPSVVVIDDVHWLDASSRHVLARVAARLCVSGHTIVCGARDDNESREQLRRFHAPLPVDRVETLTLGPLSPDDATQVITEYLGLASGAAAPRGLVTELMRLSDGTPLSLIELLRLVLERGHLRPHQDSWLLDTASVQRMRLPSSSRALIDQRLSQLPVATLHVLRAAAVGRGRIDETLLMHATGSSLEQVWSALAAAVEARLLTRGKDGGYEFVHDSVWEGLLRDLPQVERRQLHQRAAEALQSDGGDGPLYEYELARHYVGGLLSKQPAQAFEATRRAAMRAFEMCDHALAMSFFKTAKAAARLAGIDPGREFYVRIAETSLRLGATRQSLSHFGRALERSSPGAQRAHVFARIAWIHHFESNAPACMRSLEAALAEFGKRLPGNEPSKAMRAGLVTLLGQAVPRRGRFSAADTETLCSIYIGCARIALDEGQPGRAMAAMLQLASLSRQLPPSRTAVHAELLLAFALSVLNSGKLWRKSMVRAQRMAREIADPVAQTLCHQFQHNIAGWRGDYAEAERQALACVVERGHFMELSELCSVCFSMYMVENVLGRPEHALQWLERAIERVCMFGQAAAAFETIEEAAYVTLRSLGREKQASLLKRRLAGVRRAELCKTGVFHVLAYQTRVQALVDRGELGGEFEALVAEFERLRQSPTRVHLVVLGYYLHVAHARVQQCLRADPVRWPVLVPRLERALADLEAAERVPLVTAHARFVKAALCFFRNRQTEANQYLSEAERFAQQERCVWVSFAVARLRAHMLRANGNEAAARDQARIAALWAEQYGQHSRLLLIRDEFPIGPQTRVRAQGEGDLQPGRSLDALLHISQANSRELGPESHARMIVDEVIGALNAERALLFMREGPGTGLLLRAARRAGGDDLEPDAPYERTLVQQVYATGQTEIGVAVLSYGTAQNIERACLVCALVLREQAVGVVYLDRSTAVGDFTPEDALLLQDLANQVPIALELANALRERERLQSNLRRAQKMEAIGRVAGGIAHDFNNILTAIQLAAGSLSLSSSTSQSSDIDDIVNSARRGAELTRQLLNFSRGEEILPQRVVLGEVVSRLQPMLRRLVRRSVELNLEIDPEPLQVLADPVQIERMLTNLCRNADDAMSALSTGGAIRIAVGPSSNDPSAAIASELRQDTAYGQLVVSDTGAGMSEDVRARLFEPFFTTKSERGGTGLGLANVYTIVQHCGGHIEVISEPGAGSLFRIYIPLVTDTLSAALPPPPAAGSQERIVRPHPSVASSVLVVDDDDTVRRLMVRALKRAGYSVFGAEDAFVAQRLFDEHRESLALTVTDMQMPGMDGSQLAAELLARDPNMRVLFVSGEQKEELLRQGLLTRDSLFLRKPFTPKVFIESVHALIGASTPN
ncbi:MAG TPA: ATP-binding protein [Polyangiales bacterium]|nr:ATP-binding protein [Polyangiales bacterium]